MPGEQIAQNIAYLKGMQANDPFAYNYLYGNATPNEVASGVSKGHATGQNSAFGTGATHDFGPEIEAARQSSQSSGNPAAAASSSAASAPAAPPSYSGPSAVQKLSALLPGGFESSYVPAGYGQSTVDSLVGGGRDTAQNFINTMLKRGTLTETGGVSAASTLGTQEAGARSKLTELRDALLEKERGSLRNIATTGYTAAGGQSGEFFDPSPYAQSAQSELGRFQGAFPGELTSAAGDINKLFDTGALGSSGGGVSGPQAGFGVDPYAQEGGKLNTGLGDTAGAPPSDRKRRTSVF